MPIRVELLNTRDTAKARAANAAVFAAGGEIWGLNVTRTALAQRCTINILPEDTGFGFGSLMPVARTHRLPPDGSTLVISLPRADSVAAGAIFKIRLEEGDDTLRGAEVRRRIQHVMDVEAYLTSWRAVPLPTTDDPWPSGGLSRELAAIDAAVRDGSIRLARRVEFMETWLLTGEEPAQHREQVDAERRDLIEALESGAIRLRMEAQNQIAVLETTHPHALDVGRARAQVVVVVNPALQSGTDRPPRRKFTVAHYGLDGIAFREAVRELRRREPGWGGTGSIGGSSRWRRSDLTVGEVVQVMEQYLLDCG